MKNNKDLISSSRREKVVFNITRLIKERNITQRQLSEELGYDESLVSKWKQGTSTPSLDMIDAIAKFFNVHPHDIYYLEEEKEKIAIKSSGTYQAEQVKKSSPWYNMTYKIVKVDGGYTLMTEQQYRWWKNQK